VGQHHRNLIRSTDRALNPTHDDHKKDNRKKKSSL
jgi:hypothetical protein